MQKKQSFNYLFLVIQAVILAFTAIFIIPYSVKAQSGRRTPPPVNIPAPTPEPTPQPSPTQSTPMKARYSLRVMRDIPQDFYMQFTMPERMQGWVTERLKTSRLLEVEYGGDANRKEAINLAKSSDETYIILLELAENNFASPNSSGSKAKQGEVWINYSVFSPKTGKTAYSGTARLQSEGKTIGVLGKSRQRACYPDVYGDEYLLLGASLEVAERIMASFNLPIPPLC